MCDFEPLTTDDPAPAPAPSSSAEQEAAEHGTVRRATRYERLQPFLKQARRLRRKVERDRFVNGEAAASDDSGSEQLEPTASDEDFLDDRDEDELSNVSWEPEPPQSQQD